MNSYNDDEVRKLWQENERLKARVAELEAHRPGCICVRCEYVAKLVELADAYREARAKELNGQRIQFRNMSVLEMQLLRHAYNEGKAP